MWSCEDLPGFPEFQTVWVVSRTPQLPAGYSLAGFQKQLVQLGVDAKTVAGLTATFQGPSCNYTDPSYL